MDADFLKIYSKTTDKAVEILSVFPWENKDCYAAWLTQTYYFVRYSTRLLALAAAHCRLDQVQLHKRYLAHLKEETGHEYLALEDLRHLGKEQSDYPEPGEIKAFYQTQFYHLQNGGSHRLMGWICFLEGVAMRFGKIATQRAATAHGVEATKFLKLHGEEDAEHINSAFKVLETFTAVQMSEVKSNYLDSSERYINMVRCAENQKNKIKIAS